MDVIKVSIAIVVIIVIALFFFTQYNDGNTTKIKDLKIGQTEKITGMINSVFVSKNNHVFIKIADNTGEITVIAFNNSNIDIAPVLMSGDQISVLGKVSSYNGKLEMIAKEITKI
jgi:DNA/RNA endonuclease YhcR with UshA esterase domain